MKKSICLILSLIMAVGLLAACGENGPVSEVYDSTIKVGDTGGLKMPLTKDAMELEWQVVSTETNLNDSWFIKKFEGITGVDINLNVMPSSTLKEKLTTLFASANIPDILGEIPDEEMAMDFAMQGAFASVEDYMGKLPNFKKTFVDTKENNWIFDSYSAQDGKLYGFYGWDWQRDINHAVMYRKDIFDKHDIKMWDTNEGFYEALKKLKEFYPESYPYTSKYGDQIFAKWAPGWGIKAHEPYYDEAEKLWKYSDTDAKFKDMLDFMKKLYDEGLMDPEFITNTQASWTSKMTQADKSFVTFDWIDRMTMFKEQTKESIPEYDLRFASPIGPNQTYAEVSQLCWARYVKKQDKKREEVAFKCLDFLLSPAGKELISLGIEGETYEIGEDGMARYLEFPDSNPSSTELLQKYGMHIEGMYLGFDRREAYFNFAPQLKEAQEFAQKKENLDPMDPILPFTVEEKEVKNEYLMNLQTAGKEFAVKYILGNESWEEWLKKAESLGSEKVVKVYNEAQKRYDNN